jgi:phasin
MSNKKSKPAFVPEMTTEAVDFAQKTVDNAQVAYNKVSANAHENVQVLDNVATTYKSGVVDFQKKAMEFANANIEQAFAFSRKFFAVKEFDEVLTLQQGFFKSQAEMFKNQTNELNDIAMRVSTEATKPLKESFEKSVQAFSKSFAA